MTVDIRVMGRRDPYLQICFCRWMFLEDSLRLRVLGDGLHKRFIFDDDRWQA